MCAATPPFSVCARCGHAPWICLPKGCTAVDQITKRQGQRNVKQLVPCKCPGFVKRSEDEGSV
jgi:hypothetical protein